MSAPALATEYSDLKSALSLVQNPCQTVSNSQFVCADCGTLGFCFHQNDEWVMMTVMDCDTTRKMYCNEEFKGCTYQQQCKQLSKGPKFECQNPGFYPDPYNCKNYHVCNNINVDELFICPSGSAYSPATKSCSLSSNDAVCYETQYNCTTFGQMGAWPSDNNIYYVCMVQNVGGELIRYPTLYRCQDGYNFVQGRCVLAPAVMQTTTSEAQTTPSVAMTTTSEVQTTPSVAMTTVSEAMTTTTCVSGSLLPNDIDCSSYYVCINGQLQNQKCPTGTSYNREKHNCDFTKCEN